MAGATTTPSSTTDRVEHYFTVKTNHYKISLVKANYSGLDTLLSYTTTPPGGDVTINETTIGRALKDGILFPLRVRGTKKGKKASATIYVPRDKIEEAFTGLLNHNYGGLHIQSVSPVLKRLVTA
jgi:hypothetical protein